MTAAGEFNFWVDHQAAEAVLRAGIRNVMILPLDATLDATHDTPLSLVDCDSFDAIGTPTATRISALFRDGIGHYSDAIDLEEQLS